MTRAQARIAALLIGGLLSAPASMADSQAWEHRVVIPTTAVLYDEDISASLERNVNALAARGFHVAAFVGGDPVVLDRLLSRRAYKNGFADDSAVTLVVMARPVGVPTIARTYRLLHVRQNEEVAKVIAPLGAEGFRLAATEFDGGVVHLAFEKTDGKSGVEYREFRNRNRRTWMEHLLADADVRARMTRVQPVALDAGLVELGAAQASSPGDVSWLNAPEHDFDRIEPRIREMAAAGYRVDLVRRRNNEFDVLMMKPAGAASTTATWDLDDGPWGSTCARGRIAGAAVGPDGDVFCATDVAGSSTAANRGLDLTARPQSTAGGAVLFRGPTCDLGERLRSTRPAAARVAFALQMEREIAKAAGQGFRAIRALAASDSRQLDRIVVFTTDAPVAAVSGPAADPTAAPWVFAELDTPGKDRARAPEAAVNAELAQQGVDSTTWIEFTDFAPTGTANLRGCVSTYAERAVVEAAARRAFAAQNLGRYRVRNELLVAP